MTVAWAVPLREVIQRLGSIFERQIGTRFGFKIA
jgi:hypothetical protein